MLRSMGINVNGTLYTIFETKQITERFQKREFVVEMADNPQYPQVVLFQLTGDRCGQLDEYKVGDEVGIEFSLRGREWTSPKGDVRYFNSLETWSVETVGAQADEPGFDAGDPGFGDPPPPSDEDDIPF